MIERLSGVFQAMKRVSSINEFIRIVRECTQWPEDDVCRLHIYPYSQDPQLIILMYIDGSEVSLTGFDPVASAFVRVDKGIIKDAVRESYVEVYRLSKNAVPLDIEVIEHAGKIYGNPRLLEELSFNEFVMVVLVEEPSPSPRSPSKEEDTASAESDKDGCGDAFYESLRSFGESGFSESLSRQLSNPSTIAKILLYSDEYVIVTKECGELPDYIGEILSVKDHVAIKLKAGDYSVWLVRLGDELGIHDFIRGKPASSGTEVIDNWEKVKVHLNGRMENKKKVDVYVYSLNSKVFNSK